MFLRMRLAGDANHMGQCQEQESQDKLGLCPRGAEEALCTG